MNCLNCKIRPVIGNSNYCLKCKPKKSTILSFHNVKNESGHIVIGDSSTCEASIMKKKKKAIKRKHKNL